MAEENGLFTNRAKQLREATALGFSNPRAYLRGAGAIAGGIGDLMAYPLEAITPQFVSEGIASLARSAVETEPGRYLMNLARENPEIAKDLGALINIVGVVPVARIATQSGTAGLKAMTNAIREGKNPKQIVSEGVKKAASRPEFVSDIVVNMPVLQRGGPVGDVIDAVKGQRTPKEILTGTNKFVGSGLPFYPYGLLSSGGEVLGALPYAALEAVRPSALARREETGRSLRSRTEEKQLIKDQQKGVNLGGRAGMELMQLSMHLTTTGKLPKQMGPGTPIFDHYYKTAPLDIDVDSAGIKGSAFKGVPDNIAERHINHIKNIHNLNPNKKTNVLIKRPERDGIGMEFAGAKTTTAPILRGFNNGSLINKYKRVYGKNVDPKGMVEITQLMNGLSNKNLKKLEDILNQKKVSRSKTFEYLLSARKKTQEGKTLSSVERKYLDAWEEIGNPLATVKDTNGNIISNSNLADIVIPDDGLIHSTGSFLSSNKELGGVNYFLTTDIKNLKSYVTGSDKADLFDMEGGKDSTQLIITVPTQVINHTSTKKYKFDKSYMRSTHKKTDLKLKKKMLQQRRDIEDTKFTPKLKHYKEALSNQAQLGATFLQTDSGLFTPPPQLEP
jgi:hypothetical protein|tara:strand:- start:26 stop:1876 length:1851 start_codon:yes stop_codon:yes gene_type:complete